MFGIAGGYLFVLCLFAVLGAVVGLCAHQLRAAIGGDERPPWDDGITGFFLRQEHEHEKRLGWKFGPDGWYDGMSDSNLARYVIGGAVVPPLLGLLGWQTGITVFVQACRSLSSAGVAPGFCPY
jgi:hypothetical protein